MWFVPRKWVQNSDSFYYLFRLVEYTGYAISPGIVECIDKYTSDCEYKNYVFIQASQDRH